MLLTLRRAPSDYSATLLYFHKPFPVFYLNFCLSTRKVILPSGKHLYVYKRKTDVYKCQW